MVPGRSPMIWRMSLNRLGSEFSNWAAPTPSGVINLCHRENGYILTAPKPYRGRQFDNDMVFVSSTSSDWLFGSSRQRSTHEHSVKRLAKPSLLWTEETAREPHERETKTPTHTPVAIED